MSRDCSGSWADGHAKGAHAAGAIYGSGQSADCLESAGESAGFRTLRPSTIGARTRIVSLFMRPPEEILHHCIHSSVPFGVAGRLTLEIIAYFERRRKGVMSENASSIYFLD